MLVSAWARVVTFGASAAAHGGVVLAVALGHAPAFARTESIGDAPTIDVETIAAPVEPEPQPLQAPVAEPQTKPNASPKAMPLAHTHPYPVAPGHGAHPHDPSLEHPHAHPHDDAPAPIATAPAAPPRFSITVGTNANGAHGHDHGSPPGGAAPAPVETLPESRVAVPARVASRAPAAYPPDARAQGLEANVDLEIVVDESGAVVDARVKRRVGYGFDESALAAIRRYRFTAARNAGAPVRVRMAWTVQFHLD